MLGKGTLGRKLFLAGSVLGIAGMGGGYAMYQRRLKENNSITAESFNAMQNQEQLKAAFKTLLQSTDHSLTKLYRYTTCPWCGTVKAFLDYHKIAHECVEVEPMFKGELSESLYKKVPQLRFDTDEGKGPYLVDSGIIVETLSEHLGLKSQLTDADISKWRQWARGPLVRLITLEFNCSLTAAWRGYSYIDNCDTIPYANKLFLKVIGAPVMYIVATKLTKPRLIRDGIMKPDDNPKIRLHEELKRFSDEALVDAKTKKPRQFHGGSKPDLADLDAYGVLQSVRGHRVYNEIIAETNIGPWLASMDEMTGKK